MAETRVFAEPGSGSGSSGLKAGIVTKIRLENFMCHSNLEIELGDRVNFITGQNGSGKSAILTALCVAFGCRAKSTDRASTLKDFIKNGCSSALVHLEIKNQGEDAFKPETYGRVIIIERKISESTSAITLKDYQGKKVTTRRDDLRELVEHFNIDVENPCVVMSQDKSREFLHSGNDKDKFKFFFKATLLSQVDELLKSVKDKLDMANGLVIDMEKSIAPVQKELDELQRKIKSIEYIEEISQQEQVLRKKLAWLHVYGVDKQLQQESARIRKLKERVPQCEDRIRKQMSKISELEVEISKKRSQSETIMKGTSKARRRKEELEHSLSLATKEKLELEQEYGRKTDHIQKMAKRIKLLQQQLYDSNEQLLKNTQAMKCGMEEELKALQDEISEADLICRRLKEEEDALSESIMMTQDEIKKIDFQIKEYEKKEGQIRSAIRDMQMHQKNKVTAFGGSRVTNLLQAIERHHHRFKQPPIGPIGAHVALVDGDSWAIAVENAIGKLLNAFIVTDHKDSLLLRSCAREADYRYLQILIYDFSRPRLHIPNNMLPQTNLPTTLSVIHSDNPTVFNVLVDMGHAERQVLVSNYNEGTAAAFDQRISNLKEVYTSEGYKMFSRGSAQTILPPNKNARTGRLCSSYDDQIKSLEGEVRHVQEQAQECKGRKRKAEQGLESLKGKLEGAKKRRTGAENTLMTMSFRLKDKKKSYDADASTTPASSVDDLQLEISKLQDEIIEKESSLEKLKVELNGADNKVKKLKDSFEDLCESAKEEIDALEKASRELAQIDEDLLSAKEELEHYQQVMKDKVTHAISTAEENYQKLQDKREESCRMASIICPESEIEALGGCGESTPEQLTAHINRLKQRVQQESQRHQESIDELRMLYQKKERKILKEQKTYKAFREKLSAIETAIDKRWSKFQRNATLLKRQLTWQFNGHLRKKGISGHIKVSYEEQKLSIEVKMPQDASSGNVRDTRGLSGGERSFSTLCFTLALHEMTEAPFRAMDEFDVFMDAVSRKISLDTIVDFALAQGSQWIFITPHDISLVKQDERIKKQQMAAPRA